MSQDELVAMYRDMVRIRVFEERAAESYAMGKIGGFLHLAIGEEAVNVGAMYALRDRDHVFTHYRDHGQAIARGIEMKAIMAELYGRRDGVVNGRGGSMHLADPENHFWGGYAIVGSHLPLATGMAWSRRYQGLDEVVLCIFGDGATNIGEFHEALNWAALWHLPVVFLCENNFYGMGTALERASAVTEIYRKACAYDIPAERCDGMGVLEVKEVVGKAVEHARGAEGPYFVEAVTYRFRGHSMADPEYYRDKAEIQEWRERDPIGRFKEKLLKEKVLKEEDFQRIQEEVEEEVEEAVQFADQSPAPEEESVFKHIYVEDGAEG